MRTTKQMGPFTLDLDVARRLEDERDKTEVPVSRLVNRALRKLFSLPKQNASREKTPA